MKYTIVGAGAIGGTIGAFMTRAGYDVTVVDVSVEHVAAINEHGLELQGYNETFNVQLPAFTPGGTSGPFQGVVLATKAQGTEAAVEWIRGKLAPDGFVVSAQNGLNEAVIERVLGRDRTVGCLVNFSADYLSPGVVHYAGPGAIQVGELSGLISSRCEEVAKALSEVCPAGVTENIAGMLWSKEAYGAMLAGTALTDIPMAECIDGNRQVLAALAREVLCVCTAVGVTPEGFDGFEPNAFIGDDREALDASIAKMVARRRGNEKKFSGIWRDIVVRKRQTEVEAHVAPIIAEAERQRVEVPLLRSLLRVMSEVETGRRPLARENLHRLFD